MTKRLPYKAKTASGNEFDFEFPLHANTDSAVNVANLLSALLATLDREIGHIGRVGNGDVLQALAMALAVRTRMLSGDEAMLNGLAAELVEAALGTRAEGAESNANPEDGPIH
ncbi:MAG: hypothetical protein AAGI15_13605 [Pseudomonadota bacterium]